MNFTLLSIISKRKVLYSLLALLISFSLLYLGNKDQLLVVTTFYLGVILIVYEILPLIRNVEDEIYFENWSENMPAKISIKNETFVEMSDTEFKCSPYYNRKMEKSKKYSIYLSGILTVVFLFNLYLVDYLDIFYFLTDIISLIIISSILVQSLNKHQDSNSKYYFKITKKPEINLISINKTNSTWDTEIILKLHEPPHNYIDYKENFIQQPLIFRLFDFNFSDKIPNEYLYLDLSEFNQEELKDITISGEDSLKHHGKQTLTYYNPIEVHTLHNFWSRSVNIVKKLSKCS